jgi:WXG100 family type VII secretion target
VGSDEGELSVEPAMLAAGCDAMSAAAGQLLNGLKSLDGSVSEMLAGWQGASGGAYGDAWKQWQRGADDVENALALMAALLGKAGDAFAAQDHAAAAATGGVYGG